MSIFYKNSLNFDYLCALYTNQKRQWNGRYSEQAY